MKNSNFIKEVLSYSRAERAGIIILLIILLIIILLPSFLPDKKFDNNELAELKLKVDEFEQKINEQIEQEIGRAHV